MENQVCDEPGRAVTSQQMAERIPKVAAQIGVTGRVVVTTISGLPVPVYQRRRSQHHLLLPAEGSYRCCFELATVLLMLVCERYGRFLPKQSTQRAEAAFLLIYGNLLQSLNRYRRQLQPRYESLNRLVQLQEDRSAADMYYAEEMVATLEIRDRSTRYLKYQQMAANGLLETVPSESSLPGPDSAK